MLKKIDLNMENNFEFTPKIEREVLMISALQMTDLEVMNAGKEINLLTISHNEKEDMIIHDQLTCMHGLPFRSGSFVPLILLVPDIRH